MAQWPTAYRETAWLPERSAVLQRGLGRSKSSTVRKLVDDLDEYRSFLEKDFVPTNNELSEYAAFLEKDFVISGNSAEVTKAEIFDIIEAAEIRKSKAEWDDIMLKLEIHDLLDEVEGRGDRAYDDALAGRHSARARIAAIRRELGERAAVATDSNVKAMLTAKRAGLGRVAARLGPRATLRLVRLLPGLGWALTALDLYQALRPWAKPGPWQPDASHGWVRYGNCPSGTVRAIYTWGAGGSSPNLTNAAQASACLGGQAVSTHLPLNQVWNVGTNTRLVFYSALNALSRATVLEYWWRPNTAVVSPSLIRRRLARFHDDRAQLRDRPSRRTRDPALDGHSERGDGPPPERPTKEGSSKKFSPRRRPKGRSRDNKGTVIAPNKKTVIMKLINNVTEGTDYVEAIYNALPDKYLYYSNKETGEFYLNKDGEKIPIKRSVKNRLKQLALHWSELDLGKAFGNLMLNEFEDAVIGRLGKLGGIASRNLGLSTGVQTGDALEGGSGLGRQQTLREYLNGETQNESGS